MLRTPAPLIGALGLNMERRLLNTQRKVLHDVLVDVGIDPAQTTWTADKKGWTSSPVETLEAGLCYFLFNPRYDNSISMKCRPAPDGGTEWARTDLSWKDTVVVFKFWANLVKTELAQEDPWSTYRIFLPPEALNRFDDNSPFTAAEASQAQIALVGLVEYLQENINGYEKVAEKFNESFDRLEAAARSGAGRVDWSNQFVGLVISICLALSLAPDQAAAIWQTWLSLIRKLIEP